MLVSLDPCGSSRLQPLQPSVFSVRRPCVRSRNLEFRRCSSFRSHRTATRHLGLELVLVSPCLVLVYAFYSALGFRNHGSRTSPCCSPVALTWIPVSSLRCVIRFFSSCVFGLLLSRLVSGSYGVSPSQSCAIDLSDQDVKSRFVRSPVYWLPISSTASVCPRARSSRWAADRILSRSSLLGWVRSSSSFGYSPVVANVPLCFLSPLLLSIVVSLGFDLLGLRVSSVLSPAFRPVLRVGTICLSDWELVSCWYCCFRCWVVAGLLRFCLRSGSTFFRVSDIDL